MFKNNTNSLNINIIGEYFNESIRCIKNLKKKQRKIEKIVDVLMKAGQNGNMVFLLGNGGSAATASHLAIDLSKIGNIKTIALTDNIPFITSCSNDKNFSMVFKDQLKILAERGDVVLGISVSGKSKNIIEAITYAKENGCITIVLTGFEGGKLKDIADVCLIVETEMQHGEDMHLLLGHIITLSLKTKKANGIL